MPMSRPTPTRLAQHVTDGCAPLRLLLARDGFFALGTRVYCRRASSDSARRARSEDAAIAPFTVRVLVIRYRADVPDHWMLALVRTRKSVGRLAKC